jgi:transcriptional regulator with XRE-family HTH domain
MSIVSENIRFLRKRAGLTQDQLAHEIQIKRSLLGAYEEGRADPRLSNLLAVAKYFNIPVDDLISGDLSALDEKSLGKTKRHELKVLTVTVSGDQENIEWVPAKASAGYANGFADPEYLEKLERFSLPNLPAGQTYRAFELKGDSMLPLESGTIVVGKYIADLGSIQNGRTYVLITRDEGIIYKRLFNQIDRDGTLLCISDNQLFTPFTINAGEVLEIWEAVSFISDQLPDPLQRASDPLEKLTEEITALRKEIQTLKQGTS